jgi:hypothetical protein
MSRRPLTAPVVLAVAGLIVLAGCSSSGGSDASGTTTPGATTTVVPGSSTPGDTTTTAGGAAGSTTAPGTATTTSAASTTTANPPGGCTSGATPIPGGAKTKQTIDVDGDGKADMVWIASDGQAHVTVGIATAAGGGSTTPFDSASPVERSVLVVDADNAGPAELIFSDGRGASLYAFVDCKIQAVQNPEGQHYAFDLGDRIGTGSGIGCVGSGAARRLVGFNVDSSQGAVVQWSYTPIILRGLKAHNGKKVHRTFQMPADQAKFQTLQDVTCGNTTIQKDGVTLGNV